MATDEARPAIELVALLASAGGLDAFSVVLGDLPDEFPAAVVVEQHLGGLTSVLATILGRRTPHRVSWAHDGDAVTPGQVVVCPPGVQLELTPDGRCRLRATEAPGERRFDVFMESVAQSYGPRSVAVVLSGSGRDGAAGTAAMKRAGAIVIAQSPDTAQYASMPIAAARAGADLVLPIHEIGRVLADIVNGAPLPEKGKPATPPAPGSADQSMDRAPNNAATRAEMAWQRAAELRRRREDLSEGFGATEQTVSIARRRAQESLRRAQLAHQAASEASARWGH
jgi:CheB methylesterase